MENNLERNLNYQINDLEIKVEKLQMALFDAKKHILYQANYDSYLLMNDIHEPTVGQIFFADKFATKRIKCAESQTEIWNEIKKVTGEK
ncbi:MAG: hypothetical protein CMP92_00375 [Gammaproteobacteria bacterium]|nr:hypothetical protein [Gammaproteobacteria bacterium]|tara:strand:- start:3655 stop:3921 length:267 start_codon:yes stop_codon:yes gene_type:complete